MTGAAALESIARKAAAGFAKDTRSERSLALGLLRSWHEAEKRGIDRMIKQLKLDPSTSTDALIIALTETKKEYTEACEALGGVL